ncbi:MAG: hypothetical protein DCC58_14495 [Chloroflexi bacterium]|nr:MAG: hypothetical protein DCC58_14495 [Chloroflexota bacterium]
MNPIPATASIAAQPVLRTRYYVIAGCVDHIPLAVHSRDALVTTADPCSEVATELSQFAHLQCDARHGAARILAAGGDDAACESER